MSTTFKGTLFPSFHISDESRIRTAWTPWGISHQKVGQMQFDNFEIWIAHASKPFTCQTWYFSMSTDLSSFLACLEPVPVIDYLPINNNMNVDQEAEQLIFSRILNKLRDKTYDTYVKREEYIPKVFMLNLLTFWCQFVLCSTKIITIAQLIITFKSYGWKLMKGTEHTSCRWKLMKGIEHTSYKRPNSNITFLLVLL